jgi:electron transport complex protein RnfE
LWGFPIINAKPLLIAILPAGGFLAVGILMAFFNWIDIKFFKKTTSGASH